MDVASWLHSLGLEQYIGAFQDNAIDGDVLRDMTDEDLRHVGVSALGHRKKLLDAIRRLGASRDADPKPRQDSERRQVTVLFADLVGFTALSRQLDAEELHSLVDVFFQRVDPIVLAHGGYLNKHIGDCVMGVFGAPVSYGNDAVRAVHAALEIRDAVAELAEIHGRRLQVHSGVAAGQVVASTTGSASHQEYTVTGESVNLASRLAAAALPGAILISDSVMRSTRAKIECADAGLLNVKGFSVPVRAWQVLRRSTDGSAQAGPLVGRQEEVERFTAAAAACRASGRGEVFYLRGEAGMGKTRLVEEFQRIAREAGFTCHAALVLDFGGGWGLDAIGSLVRSLLNVALTDPAEARRSALDSALAAGLVNQDELGFVNDLLDLPHHPDLQIIVDAMDNDTRRAGRIRIPATLVQRVSIGRPILVVVEDVHWASETTLAQLAEIAAATARSMAILAMTSRVEGDPLASEWREQLASATFATFDLEPLQDEDARALASGVLAASSSFVERCIERAAGNPDLERAEIIAADLELEEELARIHFLRGNLFFPSGDTKSCSREHERALELAKKVGSAELEVMALGGLADAQFVQARMVSACKLFESCVSLAQDHGFVRIATANRPMAATSQYYSGNTAAALDIALLAIAEAAKVGNKRGESLAQNAAALCYRELQDYEKAFDHLEAGLKLVKSLGARRFEAVGRCVLADVLRRTGDMDGALHQVNQALATARETGLAFSGPRILGELALITDDPKTRAAALAEAEELLAKGAAVLNQLEFRKAAIEVCLREGEWDAAERHAKLLEDYTRAEPLAWAERVISRARERVALRK